MKFKDLTKAREKLGLTQAQLAEKLEIPVNTWARWERGELAVQHPRILQLALKALGA